MDSAENFMFEVPIVNLDIEDHKIATVPDNDCCIIETEATTRNYYAYTGTGHNGEHKMDKSLSVTDNIQEPSSPIIIDDSQQDNDCTIVENVKLSNNKHGLSCFDETYKENKLLLEFMEKCLDMENTQDMLKIINITLIPIYNDTNESFRKSAEFKKYLLQKIMKLDTEPERKFSHIKDLCNKMKSNKDLTVKRKRVSLITLETNLNGKYSKKSSKACHRNKPAKRKRNGNKNLNDNTLITCDSDTDVEITKVDSHVQIIDSDSDSSVQIQDDDDVIAIDDISDNSNKENSVANAHVNNTDSSSEDVHDLNKIVNPGELLKPRTHQIVEVVDGRGMIPQSQVAELERQIGTYQKLVEELEEQEVTHDSASSPYVLCEQYKAKIVSLYKELCEIMGAEAVKRHEVRLKVAKGHPEGPVKCLEDFINSNIDEHGNPPFPDMADVTQCVCEANTMYKLNWNRHQILNEAQALFVQYGRAIQKRRQNREWRDLLKYVKEEAPDPAEDDPALLATLDRNQLLARRKEQELLQKYVDMENPTLCHNRLSVSINNEEDSADSDYESTSPLPNICNYKGVNVNINNNNTESIKMNNYELGSGGNVTHNLSIYVPSGPHCVNNIVAASRHIDDDLMPVQATDKAANQLNKEDLNNLETSLNVENVFATLEGSTLTNYNQIVSNLKTSIINSICKDNLDTREETVDIRISEENADNRIVKENVNERIVKDNAVNRIGEEILDANSVKLLENRVTENIGTPKTDNVLVKREPEDVSRMLEELGDDFTTTIIDILDPFMVIEVSDSSDSEEEGIE